MKLLQLLQLAAVGSAFVLPPEEVLADIVIEDHHHEQRPSWYDELVSSKDRMVEELKDEYAEVEEKTQDAWQSIQDSLKDEYREVEAETYDTWDSIKDEYREVEAETHGTWNSIKDSFNNVFDHAYEQGSEVAGHVQDKIHETAFEAKGWLEETAEETADILNRPHHPHHKPNLTVYQLIAGSKYTTKLAKLINEYDDLVDALNSTKANFTVFAPTDKAFEKIPDHAPKPSKEFLKKVLSYHVVPDNYPAARVLGSHTAPTLLKGKHLGYTSHPQRIAFRLGLRGLTINFYSRVIAINIFGTNGVVHGIDSILVPPPPAIATIDLLPGEFSTLELGLAKSGLLEKLNSTDHPGGTIFAPSNFAFQKLGPRINAFLFSKYGTKYLKALLEYHVVTEHTLYSDALYDATKDKKESSSDDDLMTTAYYHYDLPTLLKKRQLAVDVARYGRWIEIKINAFSRVTVSDGVVDDGVIHVVSDVIVPPKRMSNNAEQVQYWQGEEMSVEELKERLEPFVAKGDL